MCAERLQCTLQVPSGVSSASLCAEGPGITQTFHCSSTCYLETRLPELRLRSQGLASRLRGRRGQSRCNTFHFLGWISSKAWGSTCFTLRLNSLTTPGSPTPSGLHSVPYPPPQFADAHTRTHEKSTPKTPSTFKMYSLRETKSWL